MQTQKYGELRSYVGTIATKLGLMPAVRALRLGYHDWVGSRRDPEERWRGGLDEEVEYWRRYLETKGFRWPDEFDSRVNPNGQMLSELVAQYLPSDRERVRILDVGSGPVSSLGFPRLPDGRVIELTAADALADRYEELLHTYRITPPAWPLPVAVEELSEHFGEGVFDLVHARNALDHTVDAFAGIRQMVRVVRPGCYVILQHYPNVAEFHAYTGLHGWNLDERKGRFVIWQRGSREIDLEKDIGSAAEVSAWRDSQWVYCAIKRKVLDP